MDNIFSQEDATIIGVCTHGHAQQLDESRFKPEWLGSDLARQVVQSSIDLARNGKEINATSIIARAKISVASYPGFLSSIIYICQNGYGEAVLDDAIQHSYEVYVTNQARQVGQEMIRLADTDPHNFNKWLPRQATSMVNLIHQGETYDPRPSVQAQGKLPGRLTESWITGMNEVLRGGYLDAYFGCYVGVTSHGKSVTLKSHVVDLALQKFKVAFIITENTTRKAAAQLAASICGIDYKKEVVTKNFLATATESAAERGARYTHMLEYLDEYVLMYTPSYFCDDGLKRIAKWERPAAIVVDYFKKQPGLFKKASYSQDEVGDFADFLLDFAMDEGVCLITAGQMSKDAAKKFVKTGNTEDCILYGTARVEYATDQFIPLRRHPRLKNTAEMWVKKDRDEGQLNSHHIIPIDVKRGLLQIKRLQVRDEIEAEASK